MKRNLSTIFALIIWFAVITQYYLMLENKVVSTLETTVRFFSFFTILTNILAAIYLSYISLNKEEKNSSIFNKPGTLTAITMYITVVGLVYQLVLRQTWSPTGLQMIVNEILHSVSPILLLVFWFFYEKRAKIKGSNLPLWLIYPFVYMLYILISGSFTGFYPYPFVDVNQLGFIKVMINCGLLIFVFSFIAILFLWIANFKSKSFQNKSV